MTIQTNSINKRASIFTLDPGFQGPYTTWHTGIIQGTDDTFEHTYAGTVFQQMLQTGEITAPLQPAFLVTLSATLTDVVGNGNTYYIPFDTKVFDPNNDYLTSTHTFYPPVTGKYVLFGNVHYKSNSGGGDYMRISIDTSNREYEAITLPTNERLAGFYGPNDVISIAFSVFADMDICDGATLRAYASGGNGVDDILGGDCYTWFAGYLAV